jgi:hypothetical protein
MPPQQVVQNHNKRAVALKVIARIKELMGMKDKKGKPVIRYTGWGADTANSLFSQAPSALDARNDAERELVGLVKRLRAPERNKLFGAALSKYDITDSNAFMAGIHQNPETMLSNLDTLESALSDENAMTEDTYPALVGARDTLPTSAGDPGAFSGAKAKPRAQTGNRPKAPAGAKVGKVYPDKKSGKRYKVLEDMTLEEVP